MIKIRTINSEFELKEKLYENLKLNLKLEQKAFYFGKGAENYYSINSKNSDINGFNFKENFEFLKNKLLDKKRNNILISLGCGNSEREKYFLKECEKENIILEYYGVESSMSMIELSFDNLKNINQNIQLIYGDFGNEKFKENINNIIHTKSKKIYVFFGTLSNIPQNYIINTLSNILNKGDILWIDVFGENKLDYKNANKYFKQRLIDQKKFDEKFILYPLKALGIPLKNGKLTLEMIKEASFNSLLFKSSFYFEKDAICKIGEEEIKFLKNTSIDLIEIRRYDFETLLKIFKKYGFKIIKKDILGERLRVAFEKK